MNDLVRMIQTMGMGEGPRLGEKVEVDGLKVSTVDTYDMGWETAVIDENGAYPVERYDSYTQAEKGHARWVERAAGLTTVTKIGYGEWIEDKEITLKRRTT